MLKHVTPISMVKLSCLLPLSKTVARVFLLVSPSKGMKTPNNEGYSQIWSSIGVENGKNVSIGMKLLVCCFWYLYSKEKERRVNYLRNLWARLECCTPHDVSWENVPLGHRSANKWMVPET